MGLEIHELDSQMLKLKQCNDAERRKLKSHKSTRG